MHCVNELYCIFVVSIFLSSCILQTLQQRLAEKLNFILKVKKVATPLTPFSGLFPLLSKLFGTLPPSNSIFGRSYTPFNKGGSNYAKFGGGSGC